MEVNEVDYKKIRGDSYEYYALVIGFIIVAVIGLYNYFLIISEGEWITNLSNRVPWGLFIMGADLAKGFSVGCIAVAFIAELFLKKLRPLSRVSAFLAILFMVAGVTLILMDIGRPAQAINIMMYSNPKSILSLNSILYSGYILACAVYLLANFEKRKTFSKVMAIISFGWGLVMIGATGLIVGLIYSRAMLHTAMHAPLSVALGISSGLGIFILVTILTFKYTKRQLDLGAITTLSKVMGAAIVAVLFLIVAEIVEKGYTPEYANIMYYTFTAQPYAGLWAIFIIVGCLIPLILIAIPKTRNSIGWLGFAGLLHSFCTLAERYLTIAPAFCIPREYLPGFKMTSLHTLEGLTITYIPNAVEWGVFFGVFSLIFLAYIIGLRFFELLPLMRGGGAE